MFGFADWFASHKEPCPAGLAAEPRYGLAILQLSFKNVIDAYIHSQEKARLCGSEDGYLQAIVRAVTGPQIFP